MIFDNQAKLAAAAEKYTEKGKDIMAKVVTVIIIIIIILIISIMVIIIINGMVIQTYYQHQSTQ